MRFSELLAVLPETSSVRKAGDPEIARVVEDSRQVQPGDLFIARSGTKVSGAQFAADALAKGAVAVVSDEDIALPQNVAFVRVGKANLAMATLAHHMAGNPAKSLLTLMVTGTKGKSTIVYLLRSILNMADKKCGLIGTVQLDDGNTVTDSNMTTPGPVELADLFSRMKKNECKTVAMEVSSHALHQGRVAGIPVAVGMFTNLTGDHLDYHGTMDEYAAAKAILFEHLEPSATAVINADDTYAPRMTRDCKAKIVRYGIVGREHTGKLDWEAAISEMTSYGMTLEITGPDGIKVAYRSPLVGRHNAYNTLCAMAATYALGVPVDTILWGLDAMPGVPGRLEPVIPAGVQRANMLFQVLVDYAHTHDSLENVLSAVRMTMPKEGKLICVFGCGGDRDRTKRPKMAAVAEKLADRIIVTSDNPRTEEPNGIIAEIMTGFSLAAKDRITVEPDRHVAIQAAIASAKKGDVVLIAGKGHEKYQIVGKVKYHFDDVEEALNALKSA